MGENEHSLRIEFLNARARKFSELCRLARHEFRFPSFGFRVFVRERLRAPSSSPISSAICRRASGEMPMNSTSIPTPGSQCRTSARVFTSLPVRVNQKRKFNTAPSGNLRFVLMNMPPMLRLGGFTRVFS